MHIRGSAFRSKNIFCRGLYSPQSFDTHCLAVLYVFVGVWENLSTVPPLEVYFLPL